jgi:tetratricopeptide (TPR) repeat protein
MKIRAPLLFFCALSIYSAEPKVESLMENGHWKRARDFAEAAYKANPNDARVNYVMARVRHEFEKLDDAAKFGEAAVRLDSKSSPAHRELGEIYADQAEHVSFIKQLGFARKVRAEFDAALAIAPKDPDNLFDRMLYYLQAPGVVGGDKKKAAEIANDLIKIDPVRGYLALVRIARADKEDAKLEGLYARAVESNPASYQARIALGGFYLSGAHLNPSKAEEQCKPALDLNPDRIDAYRFLALALVLQKRLDDAAKLIARAESAIPDDLSPYVYAARGMLREGTDLGKAEAYLNKYLNETKDPEPGAPSIAGAHWSLGLVLEKQGRKNEARGELETALKIKPDFEPAKKDLKRLK